MIRHNLKLIGRLEKDQRIIARIMRGGSLVWEYIISCIARGFWINTVGWRDDKAWKNNKSEYNG